MAYSMENNRIAVVSAARTAIGKFGGSLKDISAIQLGTIAAKEAIRRACLEPKDIERVIAGENMQVSPRGNPARPVLLNAGIPFSSDDYSINMNCVSSLRGITCLAQDILFGDVSIGLVVGMENMSQNSLPPGRSALGDKVRYYTSYRLPVRLYPRRCRPNGRKSSRTLSGFPPGPGLFRL